jgi:hypothetical protein
MGRRLALRTILVGLDLSLSQLRWLREIRKLKASLEYHIHWVDECAELAKLDSPDSGTGSNIKYIVNATWETFNGSIV